MNLINNNFYVSFVAKKYANHLKKLVSASFLVFIGNFLH